MSGFRLPSSRGLHRWVSVLVALPFLITVSTGLLLVSRGFNTWMQPSYPKLQRTGLIVGLPALLQAAQSVPEARVRSWDDVSQIDIRPGTGQIRVRSKHDFWEVQVDGTTGAVVHVGQRRVSWITGIHEGAYFGPFVRYGIFFPSAVGMLILTLTGIYLFWLPVIRRERAQKRETTDAIT